MFKIDRHTNKKAVPVAGGPACGPSARGAGPGTGPPVTGAGTAGVTKTSPFSGFASAHFNLHSREKKYHQL